MEPGARAGRIVVVGGGIVGLATAYFLARRGAEVVLVERDEIGTGASGGNAGIIAPGHPPLPRPGLLKQLLRLLGDRTNPLYIAPRPDPRLARWLWGFLRACTARRYDESLALLAELGWSASACVRELIETERLDCEYHPNGWLEVFRGRAAMEHARATVERLRGFGYRVEELSGRELARREPAYREGLRGAFLFAESAFAHPAKFVRGLAEAARRRGATLRTRGEVTRILMADGRFAGCELRGGERVEGDRLVLAAGSWTSRLARDIGVRVPLQAGKGYHVNLSGLPVRPGTTSVLAETFVAVTPLDGGLRLAGTVELSGLNLRIAPHRLARLSAGARDYLRGIDEARVESTWCGLRPLTPDGLPAIGWAPRARGVFIATGHAMMGFLLGPLTGRLVSEALLDGRPSLDTGAMRADRF